MTYIKSYKELIVWQKAIELVKEVFLLTNKFPKSELYGLISQLRRASISIRLNIAEGYGRKSINEYVHFYSISYGSAFELETQLIIAKQLEFAEDKAFIKAEGLLDEVGRMLNSMMVKLDAKRLSF